ncbi:MAG TPA: response regulator [Vicinamibacterales bacterium]
MTADTPVILVVDDQEAGRFIKTTVLRGAGFRVIEASTGVAALDIARAEPVDIAVLDVNLPDMHGFEVCRRLKVEHAEDAPIFVLQISNTAVSDSDRIKGLQEGADVYLTEPVAPQLLLATVNALIRTRRAEVALAAAAERERQARQEAEAANRVKDEFLATLSHELRTPLNAMMGWIWQLQRGHLTDEARARALESLARSTRMQARIIDDLLDVSRIVKGKLQLDMRTVDLEALLEGAVDSIRDEATPRHVELGVSTTPVTVTGDAGRLEQVIGNLLTNALKFTPDGGRIMVSLTTDNDRAIVRVEDTGAGIDPAFQPYIFDQFRQAEGGINRKHSGLGLGLSIVRQLVEMHGGTVSVFSEGQGRGAAFTVALPRALETEAAFDRRETTVRLLNDVNILIVEDEPDMRDLLAAVLESSGAHATTAPSATRALELLSHHTFDVLVSDIGLPEQDGMKLLNRVRALGYPMLAVAVTAYAGADDRRRILESGYQLHVPKPVNPAALVRAIAGLLAQHVRPES